MKEFFTPPEPPPRAGIGPQKMTSGDDFRSDEVKHFDVVDLKQYFHIIVKRIWLVLLCFMVCGCCDAGDDVADG